MSTDMTGFYTPQSDNPWANFQAATPNFGDLPTLPNYSTGDGKTAGAGWNWFDSTDPMTGVKTQGALMPGLGAAQGAFNAWLGMKQYGLAKQQLAEGKRQFQLNYDAQRTTTNSQLQDRQAARVASNPNAYQSVGDYMAQNGIKPAGG